MMKKTAYSEWFNAPEMHQHSKEWNSNLEFAHIELEFLETIAKTISTRPLQPEEFHMLQNFVKALHEQKRILGPLLKRVEKHMGQLEIIMDTVDQLEMEKAYRKTHEKLHKEVTTFINKNRNLKKEGFSGLSKILKSVDFTKALGNPEYKIANK